MKRLKGSSQQVRRAQILLKADVDGPAWTDQQIADAYGCRRQTVENVRQRLVTEGFETALRGKRPSERPRQPVLNGERQAKVIALRLGPPKGFANWTLRLLAEKAVELEIGEAVSHETVRRTLKNTA